MPTFVSVVKTAFNRLLRWEEEPEEERISPPDEDEGDVDAHFLEDIFANYGEDDGDDGDEGDDGDDKAKGDSETEWTCSIMYIYMQAIQTRLRYEIKNKTKIPRQKQFLLNELMNSNCWLKADKSFDIVQKLNGAQGISTKHKESKIVLDFAGEETYYRDIFVWLPDIFEDDLLYTPGCPNGCSTDHVSPHSWPEWVGRRVFDIDTCYYIMTRRYKCSCCAKSTANPKPQCTFMGWNEKSLQNTNYGYGLRFPARLTKKAGVDKKLFRLLRATANSGLRPETLSSVLKEMYSLRYHEDYINREFVIASLTDRERQDCRGELYSQFSDRSKYNGAIPSGKYLQSVFLSSSMELQIYFETEVKKWPAFGLCLDVSYYAPKLLCKYRGQQIASGLLTITSTPLGLIRSRIFVNGENNEQTKPVLEAIRETQEECGHPPTKIAFADNPKQATGVIHDALPSVKEYQEELSSP